MTSLTLANLAWTPPDQGHCHHRFQLRDAHLQVAAGEFVGLIGPNGSGKTSLLKCAYRFSQPENGEVLLEHRNVWQQSPRWCARRIAVVLQEFPDAFGLTVEEVVAMGRTPHKKLFDGETGHDRQLIHQALQSVNMLGFEDHAFATLSGGEKQRVILARALAQQPQLLILDEPTNHLDPRYQLELLTLVRRLNIGTLASIHDLNLAAAFCDRLYVLDQGRIVASGTPQAVLNADLLREVFGVEALVDNHPLGGYPRITWITQP
ncbi:MULTISPECIES: ABC transporter ATP-binding protein [Pseudomonas]|uniref:ABC-type cobalamin/Fe3+-siderophore transport system, ATPase component n=1 Tax=Pseudomonas asplenii TaxID=53407 RepID=A0A0M9GJ68_9PSED|nr:ABC transporter ATP-binding protein [Pseudomonas fuscovaginae]KPA92604.1 ABC-type cobalamin/Fe3+-siderophore transport system, ATPase component [Pseudomonas fuscovaginae]KPA94142.1 ABC-type cobalamin/Fe3+-siderophore transport system, ATPase component [Pseudomonas fuscovaginae]